MVSNGDAISKKLLLIINCKIGNLIFTLKIYFCCPLKIRCRKLANIT